MPEAPQQLLVQTPPESITAPTPPPGPPLNRFQKVVFKALMLALWAGRKGAFGAVSRLRPSYLVCDGTVPRTKLPQVLRQVLELV